MRALVTVQTSGPEVDAVWQRVRQSATAGDDLSPTAPGTPLTQPDASTAPLAERHHLAILSAQVTKIDRLELSASGHRRARLLADRWEWLTPQKGPRATPAHSRAELFGRRTPQIGSLAELPGPHAEL